MNRRYLDEREALASREGEMVEVTRFGGPREFIDTGPGFEDFLVLARKGYVRGDLTIEEFEAELDCLYGGTVA